MWVKFVLLIQFLILSTSSSLRIDNNGVSGVVSLEDDSETTNDLPNIWEDELVNRMVREMLARDLFHEHEHRRARRQYKRDIHSSASPETTSAATVIARAATKTTRKSSATSKTKKPSKVTQTGNKNKNRATTTAATRATKATVKPSSRPIVSTTANFGSVNGSSKIKVRIFFLSLSLFIHTCSHNENDRNEICVDMSSRIHHAKKWFEKEASNKFIYYRALVGERDVPLKTQQEAGNGSWRESVLCAHSHVMHNSWNSDLTFLSSSFFLSLAHIFLFCFQFCATHHNNYHHHPVSERCIYACCCCWFNALVSSRYYKLHRGDEMLVCIIIRGILKEMSL